MHYHHHSAMLCGGEDNALYTHGHMHALSYVFELGPSQQSLGSRRLEHIR